MKRRSFQKNTRQTAAVGFSLVELLTVVAIIVLLIGILVPAVNMVRQKAKITATRATIGALSTGLEMFRADQRVGGAYPPSASDLMNNNKLQYRIMSPYSQLNNGNGPSGEFVISGAGLLVWALAGADLSGTPGFRTFRSGSNYWANDTDDNTDDLLGAYALNTTTREPLRPRVSPFIDLSKVEVSRWNSNATTSEDIGSFEIPVELESRQAAGDDISLMPKRNYPMFLDSFGGPLLYWRAGPSGIQAVDRSPNDIPTQPQARGSRGIYHFLDNGSLISDVGGGLGSNQAPVILRPRGTTQPHNLRYVGVQAPLGGGPDPNEDLDGFWAYVRNKNIQSRVAPHNADSFMLISAGPDGIYGTADDVANFDHNGAELTNPN